MFQNILSVDLYAFVTMDCFFCIQRSSTLRLVLLGLGHRDLAWHDLKSMHSWVGGPSKMSFLPWSTIPKEDIMLLYHGDSKS